MTLLIAGLFLWTAVHFVPSIGTGLKQQWINHLGKKGYAISFAALIILALIFIVFGWRSSTPSHLYLAPDIVRHIAMLLMVPAFVLFGAAKYTTRIKRFIRHPQLTGVMVWAAAHLLLNGDTRSVVLFGWLGIWALVETFLINNREGQWVKPAAPGWGTEAKGLLISVAIFVAAVFLHPYFAGVPIR